MSGKDKKVRKQIKKEVRRASQKWYEQYYNEVKALPLKARLELALHIVFGRKRRGHEQKSNANSERK